MSQQAAKHYTHYPEDRDVPIYLAYGFRAVFLVLTPYIILSSILWGFTWAGFIKPFSGDIVTWHIYEFMYGFGIAGAMAFIFTGVPEMFPGVVPLIGKRLKWIVIFWIAGRISFWLIEFLGVYITALINIIPLAWLLAWAFKPVVLDPLQRHASLGYTLGVIFILQILFFLSMADLIEIISFDILKLAVGAFMVLLLLALRRVNTEAINEMMEDKELDDTFFAYPFRYNLAVFCVALFTIIEFLYPENRVLGWLGLAAFASVLGIINDYNLKFESIIFRPYTIYLGTVLVFIALGYGAMGYDILDQSIYALNHFRHFLTSGAFGLAFFMVMVIVAYIHTGRRLENDIVLQIGVVCIVVATFLRVSIFYFSEYSSMLYFSSSILWSIPFLIYPIRFFPYLLNKRADGIKG